MILAFIGDNSFMREQAAKEFVTGFINAHGTHAIDRFAAEDINANTLLGAVTTAPFLSERRLVIVRDVSSNKLLSDDFENIISAIADSTDLVIIESKIDMRSKYYKLLKKYVDTREFSQPDSDSLVEWILSRVKDEGGAISRQDALMLVDRVGTNQQLVSGELAKLINYNPEITSESIRELTDYVPQSSIFAMLEAAFGGNVPLALELYQEQRLQGMEPQAILGMIAWQLHILVVTKTGTDKTAEQIAAAAKLNPFVVRKSQAITKRLSFEQLKNLIELATNTDASLKSSKINADNALITVILACAE